MVVNVIKIAIVEDEELIQTMMRINLEKEGFNVSCFSDGESFLELIEDEHYDIILLDIMLPGISGKDVIVQLRKENIYTPVLILTAKSDVDSRVEFLNIGSDDYLTKPFNMSELIARVNALIRRSRS